MSSAFNYLVLLITVRAKANSMPFLMCLHVVVDLVKPNHCSGVLCSSFYCKEHNMMFILISFLSYREASHSDFSWFGMQMMCILLGKENSFARYAWFPNVGLSLLKMKSNYSMTAVFTGKEESPDRRHKKKKKR